MDFKGFIFYVGSFVALDIHEALSNGVLAANLVYIMYQVFSHHKKHKKDNDQEK